jgi:hypothetical protein
MDSKEITLNSRNKKFAFVLKWGEIQAKVHFQKGHHWSF